MSNSFLSELRSYIDSSFLKEEENISSLSSSKLGISGSFFLKYMVNSNLINPFMGFNHTKISQKIKLISQIFQDFNIKPIIIFESLSDIEFLSFPDYQIELKLTLKETWKSIIKTDFELMFPILFEKFPNFYYNSYELITIMEENGFEVIFSPYNENAQLKKLYQFDFIQYICADLNFIPFAQNLSQIIINFNFENLKFQWIDLKKLIEKLILPKEKINDFFVLGGIFLLTNLNNELDFKKILEICKGKEKLNNVLNSDKFNQYEINLKKIEFMPVLNNNGELEIFNNKIISPKMKELFGFSLPLSIYYFLSSGLLSKEICFALTDGKIISKLPIADSLELRSFIENEYIHFYKKILGILTLNLHQNFKKISFSFYKYYQLNENPLIIDELPNIIINKLYPNENYIKKSSKLDAIKSPLLAALNVYLQLYFVFEKNSPESSTLKKKENELEGKNLIFCDFPSKIEEILIYCNLILLDNLNYINIEKKSLSILGNALRKVLPQFSENIIIILEIMKSSINHIFGKLICDSVKLRKMSIEESPTLNKRFIDRKLISIQEEFNFSMFLNVLEIENDLITCISRIFAFISPSTNIIKTKNLFDYDCSQYLSILNYTQITLRDLYQAIIFNLFSQKHDKNNYNYLKFIENKSFYNESFKKSFNIEVAILIKIVLQMTEKRQLEDFVNGDLKDLELVKKDLNKGLELWNEILNLLRYQEKKNIEYNPELNKLFTKADELLNHKFIELGILKT